MTSSTTQERIIKAAVELVNEKGYKGATTRSIADRAGVNEVTLFRHFGSKKGIVEAAIHQYTFNDLMSLVDTLEHQVEWDLRKDLVMLVKEYQSLLDRKRDIILISLKESGQFPELDQMIAHVPLTYKNHFKSYFSTMIEKGKMREVDVDALATNIIYLNFGYYMLKGRLQSDGESISIDDFINLNMEPLIQSLVNF